MGASSSSTKASAKKGAKPSILDEKEIQQAQARGQDVEVLAYQKQKVVAQETTAQMKARS